MNKPAGARTGSRASLPSNAMKACPSCGVPRGNVRKGWASITRAGVEVGMTCPTCPSWDEPIRRFVSASGVRLKAMVDTTPPGSTSRRQASRTFGLPRQTGDADIDRANAASVLANARSYVEEVRSTVAAGSFNGPAGVVTVRVLSERWVKSRQSVKQVTREGYEGVFLNINRHLGDRDLSTLTAVDMEELVAWLSREGGKRGQQLSPRSVQLCMVALAMALDYAVKHKWAESNVARGVELPKRKTKVGNDLDHWTPAQLLKVREKADEDRLAAAWRLTLCGLTRSDVLGLRWSDVDLDSGTVTVAQGRVVVDRGRSTVTSEPKSPQRRRTVQVEQLHPGTARLLRLLKSRQTVERLEIGPAYDGTSGLVVVNEVGVPLRAEVYSDRFRRISAQAGVPSIPLHNVRHSLALWIHSVGVTPADGAALLGHTLAVHLAYYMPNTHDAGAARAAVALGQAQAV